MSQTIGFDELAKRVDAVRHEFDGFQAAAARGRKIRLGLLAAFVAVAAVTIYGFSRIANEVRSEAYLQQLVKGGQKRFAQNNNYCVRETQVQVEATSPVVLAALSDRAKKDLPKWLEKVDKERDTLAENLKKQLSAEVAKHYALVLNKHEKLIQEEFAKLDSNPVVQQKALVHFHQALQKIANKYYLAQRGDQTEDLFTTWDHFPPADLPVKGGPTANTNLRDLAAGRDLTPEAQIERRIWQIVRRLQLDNRLATLDEAAATSTSVQSSGDSKASPTAKQK